MRNPKQRASRALRTRLAALALALACAGPAAASATPVLDVDFPDPFVLAAGEELIAYATNTRRDGRRINVQVSRSRDGRRWSAPAEAMPTLPPWALAARPDVWAPEAVRAGDRYVLYFSARHARKRRADGLTLCIGVAISGAPEGPFLPQPRPLTCGGRFGAIDASPFRDGDALWLHFKTDGNCCDAPTEIMAVRLSADGLRLAGAPAVVRGLGSDQDWEGRVIEAPQMWREAGRYWLLYAGNDYGGERYATGYARCAGPAGPCRDAVENPILRSRDGDPALIGPGHPTAFRHRGRAYVAYHGWRLHEDRQRRYRAMYVAPLAIEDDRIAIGD